MKWKFRNFRYNKKEKNIYIEGQNSPNSVAFAFTRLNAIDKYEAEIKKPIVKWNKEDINSYLKGMNYLNESSLATVKSFTEKYVEFLVFVTHKGEDTLEIFREIGINEIRELVSEEENRYEKMFTVYDYWKIINNEISEEKLSPIEKTIFIFVWNDIVKVSNDLFSYEKSNIDFENNTLMNYKGQEIQLTKEEMQVIRELIQSQEKTINVQLGVREGKRIISVGTIPVRSRPNAYGLFVEPISNRLIHDCIGSWFNQPSKPEDYTKQMRKKPVGLKFGTATVKRITDSIETKTGIDIRPITIQRHGKYYRIIRDYNLNSNNISKCSLSQLKKMLNNEVSCYIEEITNIIKKMEEQAGT